MLWRRITIFITRENTIISELFWDILYKNENCIYVLPIYHKKLFDIYVSNGIKTIPIPGVAEMDLHVSMFIKHVVKFDYNLNENYYLNSELLEIHNIPRTITNDKIKVIRWIDGEEHYQEWFIIAIKSFSNQE